MGHKSGCERVCGTFCSFDGVGMTIYHVVLLKYYLNLNIFHSFRRDKIAIYAIWAICIPFYLFKVRSSISVRNISNVVAGYYAICKNIVFAFYPEKAKHKTEFRNESLRASLCCDGIIVVNMTHSSNLPIAILALMHAMSLCNRKKLFVIRRMNIFGDYEKRIVTFAKERYDIDFMVCYTDVNNMRGVYMDAIKCNAVIINMIDTPVRFGNKYKDIKVGRSSYLAFVGATIFVCAHADRVINLDTELISVSEGDVYEDCFWDKLGLWLYDNRFRWYLLEEL